MISSVRLARAQITTSRLAFGTSRLHHMERRERQLLLAAAADCGFVHFDSAPAYGDGLAETELGQFARGRRNRLIIATKYGIPADPIVERWPVLSWPVHAARSIARNFNVQNRRLSPLTATGLRRSVEESLRRMCTHWIDILLLHEPHADRFDCEDAICGELENLRRAGHIRAFGLAGSWTGISATLKRAPALGEVVQTAESEWPEESPPDIVYKAISPGPQVRGSASTDPSAAVDKLRIALRRRPSGVVLVSTTKSANLSLLAGVGA